MKHVSFPQLHGRDRNERDANDTCSGLTLAGGSTALMRNNKASALRAVFRTRRIAPVRG